MLPLLINIQKAADTSCTNNYSNRCSVPI